MVSRICKTCFEEDYKTLVEFANRPWAFNVDCKAYCLERTFEGSEKKPPVKLILFDFDGALTLYTFMPEDFWILLAHFYIHIV